MDKATLLAAMRDTHAQLDAAAAALSDDQLLGAAPGMDDWTRKDVLAHVAWWSDRSAKIVDALLAGDEPYDRSGPFDLDALNAQILDENRGRSAADVRAREHAAYERLVAAVASASEDDLTQVGRYLWLGSDEALWQTVEGDSSAHYREHLPHLAT